MKTTLFALFLLAFSLSNCSKSSPDEEIEIIKDPDPDPVEETWLTIPVPANAGTGKTWEFQSNVSDDFEYTSADAPKSTSFLDKWDDFYHNAWTGPGLTIWSRSKSLVEDGILKIPASRINANNISTGCITSKKRVEYPVYVEVYAKVMNSTLASDVWLLSPDDTQEIDILEAYGSDRYTNEWFGSKRIHLSHHVFIRTPFTDWQPNDVGSFYTDGSIVWRNDFHRIGVYWRDPWHLEYYVDGKLVRTRDGKAQIDPLFYTNSENPGDANNDTRTGLSKAMDIIINVEDQGWRSDQGLTPTDEELLNTENNTFKVQWIRIFKPV